jgi:predicted signal transduction protein with EAL and GGDEF domain
LGHAAGDALLVECAHRIRGVMREVDVVARLGGDEFVVVAESLRAEHEAFVVADRLVDAISKPFDIGDDIAFVDASVGIAFSDGRHHPDHLLRDADIALYEAKGSTGPSIVAYQEAMIARMQHALDLERQLRKALVEDQFWVAFQPIVSLADGTVVGHEALARWTPRGQPVPPDDFIPVAESAALLDEIGRRVILQALQHQGPGTPLMFVNVAPSQVGAEGFVSWLDGALRTTGAQPDRLFLEITEMSAMNDARIRPALAALRDRGIRIALDDFGTGHSSLASLHNLPVDLLKIDRSLLTDAADDPRAKEISRMICELGHNLGLQVIAEGVETEAQRQILTTIGCDWAQGYLFGHPTPG